ncbi:serine/threonine-protein phosphatase, partial [Trifolium pratense]
RWHQVKPFKIKNVRFELDSAIDDFIWRPYVRYADKCRMFYPNVETLVPFKNDLMDEQMISFVLCLRVSELVGFESIEQYLPHRVAMQFGLDQDIPGYVSRFNHTKAMAWKHYSRSLPDSNISLYFPSRFFEADVTTRYAKCWKKSVLLNVVPQNRSVSSSQCRPYANIPPEFPPAKLVNCTVTIEKSCDDGSKTSNGDNIVHDDVPPEFPPPKLVDFTITNGKHCGGESKTSIVSDDVPSDFVPKHLKTMSSGNSVQDGLEAQGNNDVGAPSSLPPKQNTLTSSISVENCKHVLEDRDESKDAWLPSDRICESGTQEGSYSDLCEAIAAELEQRVSRLERVHRKRKMARHGMVVTIAVAATRNAVVAA